MGGNSDIDLAFPEPSQMFAAAENGQDYTFYLVAEKPEYTKRAFEWNPNVAKGDDIFYKSPLQPDKSGRALIDLEPEGKKIENKLKEQNTPARAVVVATSRPKNRDPRKKQAQVQRVT